MMGKKGLIGTKQYTTRSRVGGRRRIKVGSLKGTKIVKIEEKGGVFWIDVFYPMERNGRDGCRLCHKQQLVSQRKKGEGQLDLEGQFGSLL
jgi:hypothetical protein